jgi:poly(A)-specific ribonuclease
MEIDASSYPHRLLGLLTHISEADFVSFDLELTGIPSRLPGKELSRGGGRKTLKDRYEETKTAADRYNILQVGITCGRFDYIANKYVLRPYNITVSPLLDERLDIEREICIQSGAASFLLNNNFDWAAPFNKGVQYLSREEAERAKQLAYDRFDKKNAIQDVQLKVDDVDSLDFVRRAREAITAWKPTNSGMLEVTSYTGLAQEPLMSTISRFEKRLVHQLVRAEFTDLVSMGRQDCIRIIRYDAEREADNTRRLKNRVKESIAKQTGFRWIFEALAHGDIHQADPFRFSFSTSGSIIAADSSDVKDRFDRTRERLKTHQPVLVGHNMFTDLVYFYRSFVGPLPDTLEGFCEALHELFPRIIDTKYLATHAEGDLNASPTLQDIAEKLEKQPLPDIVTDANHDKYHNKEAYHEAGFDSLLTATIMLRLSAKLHAERQGKDLLPVDSDADQGFESALEEQDFINDGQEKAKIPVPLPPIKDVEAMSLGTSKNARKKKPKKEKVAGNRAAERKFHTRNMFDNLRQNSDSEQDASSSSSEDKATGVNNGSDTIKSRDTSKIPWQEETFKPNTSNWVPIDTEKRKPMELIPAFDTIFWNEFGNTLRIYGTEEAVLKIAAWEK